MSADKTGGRFSQLMMKTEQRTESESIHNSETGKQTQQTLIRGVFVFKGVYILTITAAFTAIHCQIHHMGSSGFL